MYRVADLPANRASNHQQRCYGPGFGSQCPSGMLDLGSSKTVWGGGRLGVSSHHSRWCVKSAVPHPAYPYDLSDAEWAILEPLVPPLVLKVSSLDLEWFAA